MEIPKLRKIAIRYAKDCVNMVLLWSEVYKCSGFIIINHASKSVRVIIHSL